MKQSYIERKKALAKAMGIEQEDVRCHDMSNLWAIKLDGTRELCVIAPDAESAAMALRAKMEEMG